MNKITAISVDEENLKYSVTLADGRVLHGLDKLNRCHIFKDGGKFTLRHMDQRDWDSLNKAKS